MSQPQFEFEAQSQTGTPLTGIVPAVDLDAARLALLEAGLTPNRLERISLGDRLQRPLSLDDLLQFNTQLSHLAAAGLPMEAGLQLIAKDLGRGKLAQAIGQLATETQSGLSLGEAFEKHRAQFPPMYAGLIDAGVRSGNLPAVLGNLGQQLQLMSELRATLWRTLTYPVLVLLAVLGLAIFVSVRIVPQIRSVVEPLLDRASKPRPSSMFFPNAPQPSDPFLIDTIFLLLRWLPYAAVTILVIVLGFLAATALARIVGQQMRFRDAVLLRMPILGKILRDAAIAQYAGIAQIGVVAGLDLPASLEVADRASGSPRLHTDSQRIVERLGSGGALADMGKLSIVPQTMAVSIDLSKQRGQLERSLGSLAALYRKTAQQRVRRLPLIVTPILMLIVASIVLLVTLSLVLPMLEIGKSLYFF